MRRLLKRQPRLARLLDASKVQIKMSHFNLRIVLGSASGAVSNFTSIIRNYTFTKVTATMPLRILFIIIQVVGTIAAIIFSIAEFTLVELCPILAVVFLTMAMNTNNMIRFKLVVLGTSILWMIYAFYYANYIALVFDILSFCSNFGGIIMIKRNRNKDVL